MFTSPRSRPKSPVWARGYLSSHVRRRILERVTFLSSSKASLEQSFVYLQATRQEWCTIAK